MFITAHKIQSWQASEYGIIHALSIELLDQSGNAILRFVTTRVILWRLKRILAAYFYPTSQTLYEILNGLEKRPLNLYIHSDGKVILPPAWTESI